MPNMENIGPILLVSPWYKQSLGGVAEVADRLLRQLNKAGVDTHLLVCGEGKLPRKIKAHPTDKNVWLFDIPSAIFNKFNFHALAAMLIRGPLTCWQLYYFIKKKGVRTVLLIYPIEYSWVFLLLRLIGEIRIVLSLHGSDIINYRSYNRTFQLLLRIV